VITIALVLGDVVSYITHNYGTSINLNSNNDGMQTIQKRSSYLSTGKIIGVIDSVAAIALVFVMKDMLKPLGIILIVLGVILAIAGGNGIAGLVLLIIAGAMALQYKPAPEEIKK
jgi:hypothetical protein